MAKDKCIKCGKDTPYDYETHVDNRMWYVEGAGQLCASCHGDNETPSDCNIEIPCSVVHDTPNDQTLGEMIRTAYFIKNK